jgi:hypothetical protein
MPSVYSHRALNPTIMSLKWKTIGKKSARQTFTRVREQEKKGSITLTSARQLPHWTFANRDNVLSSRIVRSLYK